MIPNGSLLSTSIAPTAGVGRRWLILGASAMAVSGCVGVSVPHGLSPTLVAPDGPAFVMSDGARLPYRTWLPEGLDFAEPAAVVLALHGFNDSRDAWEFPAPYFAAAGMAVYAPDQRGFGAAPGRGLWPGVDLLVSDAAEMARLLHRRYPRAPLVLMGESMGGALLMRLATTPQAPEMASYVLVAPAVWGRARMNVFLRGSLWLASNLVPAVAVNGAPPGVRIHASDNHEAIIRLSRDPLTLHSTRFDTLRGLVDLMDAALVAGPEFTAPSLFLYGGNDELVPPDATAAAWRSLPRGGDAAGPALAFYPRGYHLLLRDLDRALRIGDVIDWIRRRPGSLPSGADVAAAEWLAAQD
jgi:acylglycerol lipase